MPPTKELEQALLHQKTGDVEKDIIDVIAKALELPYAAVARVACALYFAEKHIPERMDATNAWFDELGADLRAAIYKAVNEGIHRLLIAAAIENGRPIQVSPKDVLPESRAAELCNGCPRRLECIAGFLSTPEKCWNGAISSLPVFPLRLTATWVEVEATQPNGKHRIALHKIDLSKGK